MSFGGGGGFGGFGSNNNQSTFGGGGGFGAANTNTGFGAAANTNTGFGQSNTGGSLFGGGSSSTNTPFGGGGGFGSNNANANTSLGSKPFGPGTTSTGLFGANAAPAPTFGGGFGAAANNTTPAFGGAAGGGLFGQNKTGFGAAAPAATGTTGLFGGGGTGGGFGATATGGGFGAAANTSFGAGNQPPTNNGTATVPFNAFQEKDSSGQQLFQTITFQPPYQHYSLEELRVVDYNQGRRYGSQNGQAGAFGQSTGFGGFGAPATNAAPAFGANTNTGGGLFGGAANTAGTFGQNAAPTTFGSSANTGGGLFGQPAKPAGGMFGAPAAQPAAGGGMFGGAANTGGFGAAAPATGGFGASTSAGSGLFGQQAQSQPKPAFGGFGGTTNTTTNAFGGGAPAANAFGSNNAAGGGLFGQQNQTAATPAPAFGGAAQPAFGAAQPAANTGGGLFGGGNAAGGGLFGQSQPAQPQAQNAGGLFGGFGQNAQQAQPKPTGGMFGGASTTNTAGGGLFGQQNAQPQQQGGGLFGNTSQNQAPAAGGGLFGSKPAAPAGGLFGGAAQNPPAQNQGLFGGATQQQNTGLFGGAQQNQQKPGGLFGASTTPQNAGGLFGGQQNQQNNALGGSLFASQNNQQQNAQPPPNNSLFGASGSSLLTTSMNTNPYGNDALFSLLNTPTQSPGPLATPLSSSQKNHKTGLLPAHKLNPSASTRLLTPQTKRGGGYGFTYSTYGTPSSASTNSSPGFNSSLFGPGALSRSLGKSLSTSNLRNTYTPEASILAPGAFSTNGRSFASGSLKKLNINRAINMRKPLFEEPTLQKKRVTFTATNSQGDSSAGSQNGGSPAGGASPVHSPTDSQLVVHQQPESPPAGGDPTAGQTSNGTTQQPQTNNGSALHARSSSSLNLQGSGSGIADPTPGQYYSQPSLDALRKMSRSELSNVSNFIVGRESIGKIEFNFGKPVDLSGVDLDRLLGDIIQLQVRNATVYGENTTVPKPARGSGLNVPSRITLGNSWPRNNRGRKDQKHIERLKHVRNTNFEAYHQESGEWVFTVPHFSSYGLDYEGEQYSDFDDEESSELSPVPNTPAHLGSSQMTSTPQQDSPASRSPSSPDDTFDFKKDQRKRASVPGGYGNQVAYEEIEMEETQDSTRGQSFLGERSVGSLDGHHDDDVIDYSESESESVDDQDMSGPASVPVHTTEQTAAHSIMPKSILKHSQVLQRNFGTPTKGPLVFDDDWANQLQRTISPKKQDRHALRESQGDVLREQGGNVPKFARPTTGEPIFTRVGMMESLFGETDKGKASQVKRVANGLEYPYAKRPKTSNDLDALSADDKAFHSCNKPHFGESGTLVYASKGGKSLERDVYPTVHEPISGANRDIRFTKLPTFADAVPETINIQKNQTVISLQDGVPFAKINTAPAPLDFADIAKGVSIDTPAGAHEHQAWQLLSLLFDELDEVPSDMTPEQFDENKIRYRKEKLSEFWESLVYQDAEKHAQHARTPEEKALAYLSGHSIPDACHTLLSGLDMHLATMVAQIGGDLSIQHSMKTQIDEWRRQDVLSEMDDSVRALYELISGNCARSEGKLPDDRDNKATTFSIAHHFGLDWRRAFGLRLWYGTLVDEPIELAVAQFADALRDGKELVKPTPWFIDQQVNMGWKDPEPHVREDTLWGILKLYASSKMHELPSNAEDILAPENVSGHPLNARLSFQLFQLFKSRLEDTEEDEERKVCMPTVREVDYFRSSAEKKEGQSLIDLGDNISITYAASLHTPEHWVTAMFVYTHLSSPAIREHYLRSLLAQYSDTFNVTENDSTYSYLAQTLQVPVEWMHSAAALKAKTTGDDLGQTMQLIKAGELEEAHEVLCRSVGPLAIISRDYDALRKLQDGFGQPMNSPGRGGQQEESIPGWKSGGQIYFDYIRLLDSTKDLSSHHVDKETSSKFHGSLSNLQKGLEIVAQNKAAGRGLSERVALTEIAGVVAGLVAKHKPSERSRVLKLPLTEDAWLHHSTDLSLNYYRAVMAAGK